MNDEYTSVMVFPLFYFGPVSYFAELLRHKQYHFEVWDSFPKQTYRNRCYIQAANGKLRLVIPISHDGAKVFRDIKIQKNSLWHKEHYRSIMSAYRSSPYYEYYEDDLIPLFENPEKYLVDLNLKTMEFVNNKLKLDLNLEANFTEDFEKNLPSNEDFRNHFNAKKEPIPVEFPEYTQVFGERFEFMPDLSILDLLFNEGPAAKIYLENLVKRDFER